MAGNQAGDRGGPTWSGSVRRKPTGPQGHRGLAYRNPGSATGLVNRGRKRTREPLTALVVASEFGEGPRAWLRLGVVRYRGPA